MSSKKRHRFKSVAEVLATFLANPEGSSPDMDQSYIWKNGELIGYSPHLRAVTMIARLEGSKLLVRNDVFRANEPLKEVFAQHPELQILYTDYPGLSIPGQTLLRKASVLQLFKTARLARKDYTVSWRNSSALRALNNYGNWCKAVNITPDLDVEAMKQLLDARAVVVKLRTAR